METATVGKVIVSAKIENIGDLEGVYDGRIRMDQVRRIEVDDALVDTGASTISMPKRMIDQLGLRLLGMKQARTANGMATFGKYAAMLQATRPPQSWPTTTAFASPRERTSPAASDAAVTRS